MCQKMYLILILFIKGHDSIWVMESSADVLKLSHNIKIGELRYKLKLVQKYPNPVEGTVTKQRSSSFFPPSAKISKPQRTADKCKICLYLKHCENMWWTLDNCIHFWVNCRYYEGP